MSEYHQRCDACHKRGGILFARVFYRKVRALTGKDKNTLKWRALCNECWELAKKGEI